MRFARFGPVGAEQSAIVADDGVLTLEVNGVRRQDATTASMVGVGLGIKPDPVFLRAGDMLVGRGARLGEQRFHIVQPAEERS